MPPTNNGVTRDWTHAGEDYEPQELGVPGLEVADEKLLAEVLADAAKAVEEKKNAKQVMDIVVQSIKIGVNLFRPGLVP